MINMDRESSLVAEAQGGDREALQELLGRHSESLLRIIHRKLPMSLRSVISPEDVVQDTLMAASKSIRDFKYQGVGSFLAWMAMIARNRVRDAIKHRNRAKRGGAAKRLEPKGSVDLLLDRLESDQQTPSQGAARKEAIAAMKIAMGKLSEDYQQVIRWRYLEGLPVADVSRRMERSEGAIHVMAYRALRQLRKEMGDVMKFLSWKP